jgi:hypothetical protein
MLNIEQGGKKKAFHYQQGFVWMNLFELIY